MNPLRRIGWPWAGAPDDPAWRELLAAHPQARPARVIEQHRSGYVVAEGIDDGYPAESLPEWQLPRLAPEQRAAVGDWVLVEGGGDAPAKIVAMLPRYSAIKRAAAGEHYRQQMIAANIDTVFVVSGLDADFNPRRIERYLLLVGNSGATAVVVLTKVDTDAARLQEARQWSAQMQAQGLAVVMLNARALADADALQQWLQPGKTVVLVGSSGAGKSTLTNTLLGIERMKTAQVREHDARGRHTTTHRALLALPSGACLIDTPGMRELKPTGEENLQDSFADIEVLAEQCRFRDCRHLSEPGCAVLAAVQAGQLERQRHAAYLKLRDELDAAASRLAERHAGAEGGKGGGRPRRRGS